MTTYLLCQHANTIQEQYIRQCIDNNDWSIELEEVITDYIDSLVEENEDDLIDSVDLFNKLKKCIDYDYLKETKQTYLLSHMALIGMCESDFY